jgi:hypothetical protein
MTQNSIFGTKLRFDLRKAPFDNNKENLESEIMLTTSIFAMEFHFVFILFLQLPSSREFRLFHSLIASNNLAFWRNTFHLKSVLYSTKFVDELLCFCRFSQSIYSVCNNNFCWVENSFGMKNLAEPTNFSAWIPELCSTVCQFNFISLILSAFLQSVGLSWSEFRICEDYFEPHFHARQYRCPRANGLISKIIILTGILISF